MYGYAQIALAHVCRDMDKKLTLFVAKRGSLYKRTQVAKSLGANIIEVPMGYLSHTRQQARQYYWQSPLTRSLVPYGLDCAAVEVGITRVALEAQKANNLPEPEEVWSVAGSGTLTRALQGAWPNAKFFAVAVASSSPNVGRAYLYHAEGPFERDAKVLPPFPTVNNYDGKAWAFVKKYARPGAWFWNVAGDRY